jgi:hypothetical protein
MISFFFAGAVSLLAMQAGIDRPRAAFSACLHTAMDSAQSQNVAAADFSAFVIKTCGADAENLKAGLVGFDVKNGVKRAQATSDAQAQIDDYVASTADNYEFRVGKPKVATAQASTPAPTTPVATPAAAPKQ